MPARSPSIRPIRRGLVLALLAAIGPGCGPKDTGPDLAAEATTPPGDPEATRVIQEGLNVIINEAETRYRPLTYEYDEDLLKIADRLESDLSGDKGSLSSRHLPNLDEAEERDHFRETIRRWEARQNGQPFRAAIDPLIAEVAARKPSVPVKPDFHKRFGLVFDSFIPIEVQEARERRNRAIRAKAEALFAPYRDKQPEAVKHFEKMLDQQYPQAPPAPGPSAK